MACMKLGSRADVFQRQGQAWFCRTGLPSDIVVEVGDISFHLHKFPLLSRSGVLARLIAEAPKEREDCVIELPDIPGGSKTFELVAKFCYNVKFELTASNIVHLRCAAEHLQMTEEYGDANLISQTETFLNQVVLRSWKDTLKALQTCDGDVLPYAEELHIVKSCIESLSGKASSSGPNLFGWPIVEQGLWSMQSPGGSVLWNGISIGAKPNISSSDWWYGDLTTLSLPLYMRLIAVMESHGISHKIIAGSLVVYAEKFLPGFNRHKVSDESSNHLTPLSEEEQKILLEDIDKLLPLQRGLVPTKFLLGLLRLAMILQLSPSCKSSLEKRIGMQLDEATAEDLLMPNFTCSDETLYNVDCVQRVLEHFLAMDQVAGGASPCSTDSSHLIGSPSQTPITMVAKLIDGYLVEIAPDVNLKLPKFQALAAAVPEFARPLDDGLYRAIDMYLKNHPWLTESEREQLCRVMDCQKLSLEACTHAAQNERLPLRVIVQVLFFEQLQLRTSIVGCFMVSDNLEGSRYLLRSGATAARENQILKVGMDSMRMRVCELEKECSNMRKEIEKLSGVKNSTSSTSSWGNMPMLLGFKMCSANEGSVRKQKIGESKVKTLKNRYGKHKNSSHGDKASISSALS
ncbi:hypothetical protein HN51_013946 [Arachis hypogaea]|uniref:BTB/POZ domain-containing protein At1g30440-like n=1 Tax=Arachis ipaensis TaxID=130454 RepID=UPI0007AF215C|nr:BTB/POZ domain-containing protein At1g30440-like [Arachis ipaensis]XP_020975470.1 BTB/POZ domain-containing protein At1g30440-like [Arachis ipaensis]XP_020975471.1 BTB/POZ domain-containing protein At1g30440-like [Arachis ipaensis]XP_020975472.1 BTB/POZ domain-containing protein At1g30440-like [Arachis ipaensis]XP_020975473.1 BTB/POZ domain-containing protein At1g30440-like [Arachis ipaensis]XP_025639368.1 BTB/POZ domain-containing protein At1g30440 [Arachis hypogaea]XP_025639369.1 BTB/POZ